MNHAVVFEGTCTDCAATIQIGSGWSSCATIRNARDEPCTGPGIAALTEVEQERATVPQVRRRVRASPPGRRRHPAPVQAPFRNPLAPDGECGLMSRDGCTCIRRLNKQGTHNRREWGSPNRIGTHPDRKCTAPFTDDDLLLPA
ncbi:hypothetical protein [Streptomyces sp. NPDC002855]|uniref:hypothetical protein n=1 Tax=Streptomyces sp. NPDC002855 TaxID=3154437 RepID=UPI00331C905C